MEALGGLRTQGGRGARPLPPPPPAPTPRTSPRAFLPSGCFCIESFLWQTAHTKSSVPLSSGAALARDETWEGLWEPSPDSPWVSKRGGRVGGSARPRDQCQRAGKGRSLERRPRRGVGGRKALIWCRQFCASAGGYGCGCRSLAGAGDPDTTAAAVAGADPGLRTGVPEGPGGSENSGF